MSITFFFIGDIPKKKGLNDDIFNSVKCGVRQPSSFFSLRVETVFIEKLKSAQKAAPTY